MSNKYMNAEESKNYADKYVRRLLNLAKDLLAISNPHEAYYEFGLALHTLQDATSPAHSGFQFWDENESKVKQSMHVKKERDYPGFNSNLQKVTNQYLDWFEKSNAPLPKENLFDSIKHD